MADTQEFKIMITGDASSGVSAFEQTGAAAQGTVGAFDKVNHSLDNSAEKAGLSERSMRRLATAIGQDIPGAGALLESAFAGMEGEEGKMMGATMLVIAGLEILRFSLEKMSEQSKETKRITEELNDVDKERSKVLDDVREAVDKAEVSEAEFLHNFARNAETAVDKTLSLANAILKANAAQAEASANRNKGIAADEIDAMEQRGVISHAAALKMKEQLDIEYQQGQIARMKAIDAIEQSQIANQLQNKNLQLHEEQETDLPRAQAAVVATATAKAANEGKIQDAQSKISGAQGVIKELRATGVTEESIETLKAMYQNRVGGNPETTPLEDQYTALARLGPDTNGTMLRMFGTQGDINLANYEGAQTDLKLGQTDLKNARGKSVGLDIAAGNAKSDLDALQRQMEKNKSDIVDLQGKLNEKKATDAINEAGASAGLGASRASAALQSDQATASAVLGGGNYTGASAQQMMADAAKIAGHTVNLQTAAQIIQNGANNIGIFMNQLDILADAMSKVNPERVEQIERKVKTLQNQMRNVSFQIQ